MKNDALVQWLVEDLRPVQRLPSSARRTACWLGGALVCVGLATYSLGVRSDLLTQLHDPSYLAQGAALSLLFVFAALSAFALSVPGGERDLLTRLSALSALLAWVLLIGLRLAPDAHGLAATALTTSGWRCVGRIGGLALAPAVWALVMLRRAAPLRPGWTGLFALLSASAVALLGTQMLCAKDDAPHLLVWHLGPVAVAALLGIHLGRRWLQRSRAHIGPSATQNAGGRC